MPDYSKLNEILKKQRENRGENSQDPLYVNFNNGNPDSRLNETAYLEEAFISKQPYQPYILDLVTRERLYFQTIPGSLEYNPQSNWVTIAAAGRNNPIYHYSGGEDILNFTITWYSALESREDVLKKCKWLESLTRNDGYDNKPHHVQFVMGELFKDAKWVVNGAKYTLTNFNREKGMMPQLAIQEISLYRVSEKNRGRKDILKIDT